MLEMFENHLERLAGEIPHFVGRELQGKIANAGGHGGPQPTGSAPNFKCKQAEEAARGRRRERQAGGNQLFAE